MRVCPTLLKQHTVLPHIPDHNVILAFVSRTTYIDLVGSWDAIPHGRVIEHLVPLKGRGTPSLRIPTPLSYGNSTHSLTLKAIEIVSEN